MFFVPLHSSPLLSLCLYLYAFHTTQFSTTLQFFASFSNNLFQVSNFKFPMPMASLNLLPHPSYSSCSFPKGFVPCSSVHVLSPKGTLQRKEYSLKPTFVVKSAVGEGEAFVADTVASITGAPISDSISSLKFNLLSAVSGLNRGLAANLDDRRKANSVAKELELAAGVVDLSVDIDKLQGKWKLVYSSAFSSGKRSLLPITLGQVFQEIDILSKDFDNIVDLQFGAPWPLPPFEATATLAHRFEIIGTSRIKIIFEKTSVKPTGSFSPLPPVELPQLPEGLRPPSNSRGSSEFEVTYVDSDTRVTRGEKGELRVYVIA